MDTSQITEAAGELLDEVSAVTGLDPKVAAIAIAVLVLLAVFVLSKPIRLILKLLINTGLGFVALILINKFGAQYGISLGVDWVNAVVTGVFGIPGVAALLALKWAGLL